MKLAVLSARAVDDATYWRNIAPPLEEALASQPGASLVVAPPFRRPSFRATKPAWLNAIRTARKADTVFWLQLHLRPPGPVWALGFVRPSARRSMYALDIFPMVYADLPRYVNLQGLAYCFLAHRIPAVNLARSQPQRRYEWLPFGFNDRVFRDQGLERDIYAFWMGRRHEPFHEALLAYCRARDLDYRYLEPPGKPIPLDELSRLAARSRYFVSLPPDVEDPYRTGGVSVMAPRYFEGLGAGCRLLGARPRSEEFDESLPRAAIVECTPDGSDLAAALEAADADPTFEATTASVTALVHREHTWEKRAEHIFERLRSLDRDG